MYKWAVKKVAETLERTHPHPTTFSRFPALRGNLAMKHERVAQLVEHRPFKALVLGSSPSPLTTSPFAT